VAHLRRAVRAVEVALGNPDPDAVPAAGPGGVDLFDESAGGAPDAGLLGLAVSVNRELAVAAQQLGDADATADALRSCLARGGQLFRQTGTAVVAEEPLRQLLCCVLAEKAAPLALVTPDMVHSLPVDKLAAAEALLAEAIEVLPAGAEDGALGATAGGAPTRASLHGRRGQVLELLGRREAAAEAHEASLAALTTQGGPDAGAASAQDKAAHFSGRVQAHGALGALRATLADHTASLSHFQCVAALLQPAKLAAHGSPFPAPQVALMLLHSHAGCARALTYGADGHGAAIANASFPDMFSGEAPEGAVAAAAEMDSAGHYRLALSELVKPECLPGAQATAALHLEAAAELLRTAGHAGSGGGADAVQEAAASLAACQAAVPTYEPALVAQVVRVVVRALRAVRVGGSRTPSDTR
jgi:hypothetical protein